MHAILFQQRAPVTSFRAGVEDSRFFFRAPPMSTNKLLPAWRATSFAGPSLCLTFLVQRTKTRKSSSCSRSQQQRKRQELERACRHECGFQHYCANCADSNLGLRAGEPALRITKALQLRQRFVGRLLHEHQAKFPPAVVKHILDFILNDLGKLALSKRWACILLRSGVQLECLFFPSFHRA